MKKRKKQEDNRISSKMQEKLAVLFIAVLLALVALTFRLYRITKDHGESYKKQVYAQQDYSSRVLPFKRGEIVDRKGSRLAYSEKVYNLVVDTKQMLLDDGVHVEPTLAAIQKFFPSVDMTKLRAYIEEHPTSQYRVFAKKLSYDDMAAFQEYEKQVEQTPDATPLKGVWFEEDYKRMYPYGTLASNVLGFIQGENEGYFGLEEYYNSTLNGTNGRQYGYLTEDSIVEQTIKPATDGNTIVTTLDTNIQSIVEKHLKNFYETHANEARTGGGANNLGCIIMDPNNGEVLAMACYPSFDLNNPRDLTPYYSTDEINAMDDDEKVEALNQIWRNYCISDTYEPGSTAKPFTVASALEVGAINGQETYNCNGSLEVGDHIIHCHNRLGDGPLTVTQGIQKSCNVVLMDVAFAMGREKWLKFNRLFNFGLKTNIDLTGEVNAASLVYGNKMNQTNLATGSFGQGFNVTMIQMAAAYCSLINGGYYYEPRMVSRIENAEGAVVRDIEPRIVKQTISNETSEQIMTMMRSVVMEGDEGTGWTAKPAGYTMGGKTGTAEKLPRDKQNYLVSFMGYVPAENPQVLCYVVVDQPNCIAQDNARYATLLTKDIMTEVLPYMNIFMTEELTDKERKELEESREAFSLNDTDISVSENGVSDNSVSENGVSPEGGQSGNEAFGEGADDESSASENQVTGPPEIKYDPETGYPLDPVTGEVLDPETLLPVSGGGSFMD